MSLPYILFELTLFEPGNAADDDRIDLGWLLEALVQRDMAYLKAHPEAPRLYNSGVVYERPAQFGGVCPEVAMVQWALDPEKARDPRVQGVLGIMQQVFGGERFRDIGVLYARGRGDCDNLATARVAELRQMGIQASPLLIWRRRMDGGYTYHVLVTWPKEFDVGCRQPVRIVLGRDHGDSRRVWMKTKREVDGFTQANGRGQAGHARPGPSRELPSGESDERDRHTRKDLVPILDCELER
jgi:hypothetical protein